MSHSLKKKKTSLGPITILRLAIFVIVVYFSITYLSNSVAPQSSVLGKTTNQNPILKEYLDKGYNMLPANSRSSLENISATPQAIFIQEKIDFIKKETADFPQKQIKEIQKAIVDQLYSNIIKNIDQP